jgi:glycine/D-amino acid oxidase-like deaminating enzyme
MNYYFILPTHVQDVQEITSNPYALFCAEDRNGCHLEVYPRPNGEVYLCGLGGSDYVSGDRLRKGGDCETPEQILPNPARVAAACRSLATITDICSGKAPEITQACMRPCPPDARPIMGPIPGVEGAYVCAGHNCWGILWGPVSGLLMSELLLDGETKTCDISSFSLERFMEKREKRGRAQQSSLIGEQW